MRDSTFLQQALRPFATIPRGLLNAMFFTEYSVTMDLDRGRAWARKSTPK